jgi:gamma-glutamyl hercynylcysteine S-oxide synthase
VLAHEDMHAEAGRYMAQVLGISVPGPTPPLLTEGRITVRHTRSQAALGRSESGFAFDNELGAHHVQLPAFDIDSRVVCWHEYLPFLQSGSAAAAPLPRYLRQHAGGWQQLRAGRWQTLNLEEPVCHVSAFEAEAWCHWAGRRLPSEAQWQHAANQARTETNTAFKWGAVWEWTSSSFKPYPGFVPHPYGDYSAPWFNTHRVLRGASYATHPRMHDLHYRNFYTPERSDIFAGFRSCSV